MTSNIGAENMQKEAALGFRATKPGKNSQMDAVHEEVKAKVLEDLKSMMRPELLNRIDKVIVFRALERLHVKRILGLRLKELAARLKERGLKVKTTSNADKYLIEAGYDPSFGVRPLRRVIEEQVEGPIATGILEEKYQEGDVIKVGFQDSKLTFEIAKK